MGATKIKNQRGRGHSSPPPVIQNEGVGVPPGPPLEIQNQGVGVDIQTQGLLERIFLRSPGRLPGLVREGSQGLGGSRGLPGEASRGLPGPCLGAFLADVSGG